jgi:uncharacterized hydrophobic protein (TIGR00271 family)
MASSTLDARLRADRVGFDPVYLEQFETKMFIEGALSGRRLVNFFVLLLLATVIANYGVLSGSTATVIGAMIVAPLMGPIMATAAAVIMGSSQRAIRSLALAVVGVLTVILFAFLLTLIVPDITISFTNNYELASRISPGLYALLTALGAGAAGAFITSRAEIADSMGGVAIAISLVPPLCVVGIAISQGEWAAAAGAMLLFTTNFLAILLAGGVVFLLLGLGRLVVQEDQARMRRRSLIVIIIATLIVAIPLSLTGYQVVIDKVAENRATQVIQGWLEGTPHQIVAVNVEDRLVMVSLEGIGQVNSLGELVDKLEVALKHPVTVRLRVVPALVEDSEGDTSP